MARGKLGFWGGVVNGFIAFLLCVLVVIMIALLVHSLTNGIPDVSPERAMENTKPVGNIYYRSE